MRYLNKLTTVVLLSVSVMNSTSVKADDVTVKFNQVYLYTDKVYDYAPELGQEYNETQRRINSAVYGQASIIFSKDHFKTCYGEVNTNLFNSYVDNVTPILPLAFSVVEWGGNGDLQYSFTPAIATRRLSDVGVSLSAIDPLSVDSDYYESMGVDFSDKSYWGPLQINKNYLTPNHDKGYKCGYTPTDYYSWSDVCQWTFHDKAEQIKNSWNKDYKFKNEYEVVAHTSIAHNSGGSHLSSKNFYLDRNWYPWRSSQSVFDYVDYITNDDVLNVILKDADAYANNLKEEYELNTESGALYKSISDCRKMMSGSNINWSLYVKDKWIINMDNNSSLTGDSLRNWEKVMYPVQSIWSYRVLQKLYN